MAAVKAKYLWNSPEEICWTEQEPSEGALLPPSVDRLVRKISTTWAEIPDTIVWDEGYQKGAATWQAFPVNPLQKEEGHILVSLRGTEVHAQPLLDV